MSEPRIQRVPVDYDPHYPAELDRATYERLIAPDQHRRIAAAAAAAAALALAGTTTAQGEGKQERSRAEAVLTILNSVAARSSTFLGSARFVREKDRQGHTVIVPHIPISFGNSYNGVFDAGRARQITRDLFLAYGLKPEIGWKASAEGVEATLDVYDVALQVGTKLRGNTATAQGVIATAEAEAPTNGLDDEEIGKLGKRGLRVHCADLDAYPLMDGDQVTPTLAYLAGIVAFLDEVTQGPPMGIADVLANERLQLPMPRPTSQKVLNIEGDVLTADRQTELVFDVDPATGYEQFLAEPGARGGQWQKVAKAPRAGHLVLLKCGPGALTVVQDGKPPLEVVARAGQAFLPSRFDPGRAFQLRITVEKGQYYLPSALTLLGAKID
ncbi:MAG: hypothetical protein KA020_04565 [Planctomycetes bacterium]|nr:hypothetical protein [Planctomycetota bacterium]